MTKPTIKQVQQDGLPVWEVSHGGIVRYFKHDWKAKWFYESCGEVLPNQDSGQGLLVPAGELGV